MSEMEEPKPCPFCGEKLIKRVIVTGPYRDYVKWYHPNNDCFLLQHSPTELFSVEECEVKRFNERNPM